jgi:hypothetical protein
MIGTFMMLHSILYGFLQRHVYSKTTFLGLEHAVPNAKQGALKELALTTYVDSWILLHTYAALLYKNTGYWMTSQYALEISVKIIESVKLLWSPSVYSSKELLAHHAVSLILLIASYITQHTHIGFMVLSITNTTNIFFDYFKFGLLTNDPVIRWMSSAVFCGMFYLSRVYVLGGQVVFPVFQSVLFATRFESIFYKSMLSGIYVFQLYWFYRLTLHTWRNTMRLFRRPSLQEEMKTDFLQLIEHLCKAETDIQTHLRSHDVGEAVAEDAASASSSASAISTASATTTTTESAIPLYEEEETMKTEDDIIHEALMQWRSCIFRQLKHLTPEEDKKEN